MKYVDLPSLVGGAPRAPRNRFTPHFAVFRFRAARGAAPTNTPRINIFPRRIYSPWWAAQENRQENRPLIISPESRLDQKLSRICYNIELKCMT